MIRLANSLDLDAIMELAESIGLQSDFQRGVALDRDHMRTVATGLLQSQDCVIVLALKAKQPIGMLGLAVYPHLLSGQSLAAQLFWWVVPEHRDGIGRALLTAGEQWAQARGAASIQMMAPTPSFGAVFTRSGYAKVADVFEKGL